jgi:HK97 family phage major capsid protein
MNTIELRQKRSKLIADMGEYAARASKEGRGFDATEKESYDKMAAEEISLRHTIEAIDAQEGLEKSLNETTEQRAREQRNGEVTQDGAFEKLLRFGPANLNHEERSILTPSREQRDNVVGTGSAGGYAVPEGFGNKLIQAMKSVAGPLQVATIIRTDSGNDLPYPTVDDTSNDAAIVAENTAINAVDLTLGQMILKAYKYPAQAKLSIELLQDNGVNVQAQLADILGKRIARGQNGHFTSGSGTSQPKGAAVAGTAFAAAAAASISYKDLTNLKYSVDAAYRANGSWMLNDATFGLVVGLVDSNNRPLITPAFGAAGETLFGQKVIFNNWMDDVAASKKSVMYGDFSQYYVRIVNGLTFKVLNELYAGNDMVGFRAVQRADGQLSIAKAVSVLTHPAS